MSAKIDRLFSDYSDHHKTTGNMVCHFVGIPMIATGLFGLLAVELYRVGGLPLEATVVLVVLLTPVSLALDWKLTAVLTLVYAGLYLGARLLPWEVNLGLFIVGWIFQFIGHAHYEKRPPAFMTNLLHLFIGPLWILNHALRLRKETPVADDQ